MTGDLATERCVPCRGGVAPLTPDAAEHLRAGVPHWALEENGTRLERRWTPKTYAEAFALVTRISALAEAERHHPDIRFGWGYCDVSLRTHAIGGLHRNDFILAAKIDAGEG